jgi:hypothetical protein
MMLACLRPALRGEGRGIFEQPEDNHLFSNLLIPTTTPCDFIIVPSTLQRNNFIPFE